MEVLIKWGSLEKSMLLDYPELSDLEKQMVQEVRQLKVPSFVELLYEDLLKRLIHRILAPNVGCSYLFGWPLQVQG